MFIVTREHDDGNLEGFCEHGTVYAHADEGVIGWQVRCDVCHVRYAAGFGRRVHEHELEHDCPKAKGTPTVSIEWMWDEHEGHA